MMYLPLHDWFIVYVSIFTIGAAPVASETYVRASVLLSIYRDYSFIHWKAKIEFL